MIKIEFRGTVTRVYEETRGNYTKKYIVAVEENGGKYANTLRFKLKQSSAISVATGANVAITAYIDGREFDGRYYVDIVGMDLTRHETGGGAATKRAAPATAAKPIFGCTAATAIETWAKYHGDDKPGFAEFCKAKKPGVASKQYTIADWADIVNAIEAAQNAAAQAAEVGNDGATDNEDLPF